MLNSLLVSVREIVNSTRVNKMWIELLRRF